VAGRIRDAARVAGARIRVVADDIELEGENTPRAVKIGGREVVEADVVVSAVGCAPNVEWLRDSGLRVDGGVHVDSRCRVQANIVAAGDVAALSDRGSTSRTPHWTNAVEQARAAAQALLRGDGATPYRPSHYYWSEQFGVSVKMAGPPGSDGTPTISDGSLDRPAALLAWLASGATYRAVALNHGIRPAQLKRLVRAGQPGLAERETIQERHVHV
jgi:hypothetical protein